MPTITIGDNISPYYSNPMQSTLIIEHIAGDTYANSTACGDKLIQLNEELQRLDFPYFFVELVTTNTDIERELEILRKLYSKENQSIKYKIKQGKFTKTVYKGDTMCIMPWIHKYVNPQGAVTPCCIADENYSLGNIKNKRLKDISTKPIRDMMLRGERPDACATCWKKEDFGIISNRQKANDDWAVYKNQKQFKLRFLDIRLSNKCNLMCRMCSGKFSNRIAQEEEKLYGNTKYKDEVLSPDLVEKQFAYINENIQTLEHVYFAGGEPLINEEHYRILQLLIDHNKTDIKISYNTNLSLLKFKKHNIIDYWSNFNNIIIGASIDLIGKQSNYVRHGVDYKTLESNYNKIKNLKNVTFKITSVLHLMNLYNLVELQKHWIELGLDCSKISFSILTNPHEQCITVLPEHYKNLALVKIHSHVEFLKTVPNSALLISKWKEAAKFMTSNNDTNLLSKFFRLNDDKDKIRNQLFEDYFPEFKDLRKYVR